MLFAGLVAGFALGVVSTALVLRWLASQNGGEITLKLSS